MFQKKSTWILIIAVILLLIYVAGPVPPDPVYNTAWPALPAKMQSLQSYIAAKEDSLPVRKDNQARIVWHNGIRQPTEYSFVYLHGFAGSYRDGYPVNVHVPDTFAANVYLARWAGHGLQAQAALEDLTPETAWESAKEALAIGRRIGKKVIIMSTSTGGTLALKLAATYPDSVFALINMSPNIKDDVPGAFLLNAPWGMELAKLVSFGSHRKLEHQQEIAHQYWDTIYPAEALVKLQSLVSTTMQDSTFQQITCPVQTLYYHKNFLEEDERVEVNEIPRMHRQLSSPEELQETVELRNSDTHFIGSDIKSKDYVTVEKEIIRFCREKLEMEPSSPLP